MEQLEITSKQERIENFRKYIIYKWTKLNFGKVYKRLNKTTKENIKRKNI